MEAVASVRLYVCVTYRLKDYTRKDTVLQSRLFLYLDIAGFYFCIYMLNISKHAKGMSYMF